MTTLLKEIDVLLGENTSEAADADSAIMQHLALAATVMNIDLDDDKALGDYLKKIKEVVTKEKSQLRSQLRRWTASKARTAVKVAKGTV